MADKKTEVCKEKTTISSELASSIHEESSNVSQPKADNCDKKKLTDTDCGGSTIKGSSAQDKQDATELATNSVDDDFSLRLESSDEDTFKDALASVSDKTKVDGKKSAIANKSETLFSDIESSDDSIVYEPKTKSAVLPSPSALPEKQPRDKESSLNAVSVNLGEEEKVIESEFDLVESDEEFFEDLPEKTTQFSQETISDKPMEEEDEEERSSTPLIDEEDDKPQEDDLLSEGMKTAATSMTIETNLEPAGSPSSFLTSDQSMDLMLESSVDIPDQDSTDFANKDNITTASQIATNLADEKSSVVDGKQISSHPKPKEEKEESDSHQTDIVTSENSKESVTSPEKSEKLVEAEALSSVHSEPSENLEEVPHGAENIPMSSTILEDDSEKMETDIEIPKEADVESSKKTQELTNNPEPEQMEIDDDGTDELIAEESIIDGDDKIDLNRSEVEDSFASEDETIFEVSDVTEMEIIEEKNTDQNVLSKPIEKEATEEQEINLKSQKQIKEIKEDTIVGQNKSNVQEQLIKKAIEQSTESSKIDENKLTELEQQSEQIPAEIASTSNVPEGKKMEKSNKEEDPIEESETKSDDKQSDTEMEEVESTEKVDVKEKTDKVDLLEKPDDGVKSLGEAPDVTEKNTEKTPSTSDDHTENKRSTPKSPLKENIDKSSKTSEQCMDVQIKDDTTIVEYEKSNAQVAELNVQKESPKAMDKQDEKSDAEKQVETLKESNKQPSDSTEEKLESSAENIDSSKEIVETSLQESDIQLIDTSEELESSKELEDLTEESYIQISDSPEKHKLSKETVESVEVSNEKQESYQATISEITKESSEESKDEKIESTIETLKSDACVEDSIKSLQKKEELNKQDKNSEESPQSTEEEIRKSAEPETDSIEMNESLKASDVYQKTDSLKKTTISKETDFIEKEKSMKETTGSEMEIDTFKKQDSVLSQETSDSKKQDEIKSTKSSEVTVSKTETIKESIKTTVTTTEMATDVTAVEKVVEVATTSSESTKTKITTNSGIEDEKNAKKIDPVIIEIDDDDDEDPKEKKESENSSKVDEKAKSSTSEKDKKTDDVSKAAENKEATDLVTPMDIDEEITTKKSPVEDKTTNQDAAKADQESAVKEDNKTVKDIPFQVIDDDEEPLLMIDTSHKEDNDAESNCMDNETATSAPTTDSSSDGSLEVFYDKECVNYECKRASKNFYRATVFAMNYFKVSKKRSKMQFVCEECYDRSLSSYEELCKTLKLKQPLLHGTTFKCKEFVEIIDSSDEDESDAGEGDKAKVSDENALPKESIEMLEAELEGAIRKVMHNVDIQKQLSWTKQILQQRLTNIQEDSDFVSEQLRALQRKADHMHNSLYQCPKIKLRQLTPLDLNSGRMYNPESDNTTSIPLPGDIIRNPICVNELYYAVKTKAIASWVPCKVIEEIEGYPAGYNTTKTYKIKFTTKLAKYPMFKTVYAKHMAYHDPPNVRLPIGSRVIAYFDATSLSRGKEKMLIPSAFYPGIIAEPLKQSNKFRYLVFYDDGYFQYVNHKDVRLVCQASENVWEDVHHQSREFIHNYLTQYAVNRPMVQTQKGQSMLVDYNGKWIYARVIDVDCSLVQMLFEGQSRSEWIYRGSTRLGPVYKESNNLSQKNTLNATRRRTEPFIRYINGDDSSSSQQVQEPEQPQAKAGPSEIRSVAKKSVSRVDNSNNNTPSAPSTSSTSTQPIPTVRHLNNSIIFVDDDNKPKGKVVYYTARKNLPPRNYVPHICNPSCPFNITHNLSFYSPLAKPLLSGWERQVFRQKSKKFIVYRGPCGKRMRNIEELHRYLRVTDNDLNVDNFDFSPDTNCLAEYVLEKCLVNKKDISCGKEKMPIPCVNYYDETMPPACEYSAVRIPTEGVPLNLDKEFLCGCDCEDDCSDKTKCACWQLTYAGAKYGMPTVPTDMVGYQYKRLYEHVPTGIYECNSRCKCKANCVNRVVQQPLQSKLQVFKTSNRGWGLRCINDVPRGSFICVYAGQMLTEQVANEGGLDAGDEYFAELDYIEVAEQIKEGYESDVQEPEEDEDLYNPEREDDDIDFRGPEESLKDKEFNTRLRSRRGNKSSTDGEFDSQERQVISFEPNKTMDTSNEPNEKPTIRKLFGKDESCYVMDAKVRGNLGRYFNHSCSPNLFVQNVFVDTHDLRFPWVAFFASTHIRAGTELTWNYNYEVGVVPGKVLYCQCGAPNCRQRLL